MKKIAILMSLLPLLTLCVACSAQVDEIYGGVKMMSEIGSRSDEPIADHQIQIIEVAKHIKFDTDSFYLDITLEEAKQRGMTEEIYNKWLGRLKEHTREAQRIIDGGGKFYFYNGFTENNESPKRTLGYPMYSGYLEFPKYNTDILAIPSLVADALKYVNFYCNAIVHDIHGMDKYYPAVLHLCTLEGIKEKVGRVENSVMGIGYPEIGFKRIEIPGDLGDMAVPHVVRYQAELEFKDVGDTLIVGWSNFCAVDIKDL